MVFTYTWKILSLHLLILPNIVSSKSISENPSWERIGDVCQSQTCKGKENLESARWCSCDRTCVKFGDCCIDAAKEPPDQEEEIIFQKTQCIAIPSLGFSLVVSTCSNVTESNSSEVNRLLCNLSGEVAKSYILDIPVSSSLSGLTYRNVHCAVCNGDARHLLPRGALLKMNSIKGSPADNPREWIYKDGSLSWIHTSSHVPTLDDSKLVKEEVSNRSEEIKTTEPIEGPEMDELVVTHTTEKVENLQDVSAIFTNVTSILHLTSSSQESEDGTKTKEKEEQPIDKINFQYSGRMRLLLDGDHIRHCHPSHCDRAKDDGLALKCSSYLMPVYRIQETREDGTEEKKSGTFRNPHCAICNDVPINEQNCLPKTLVSNYNGDGIKTYNGVLNLRFIFGDVIAGDNVCGPRSFWDPLFQQCYSIDDGKSAKTQREENLTLSEEPGEMDVCENSTLLTMSNVQWYLASVFFGVSIVCLVLCVLIHIGPRRSTENTLNNAEKRESQTNLSEKKFIKDRSFHTFVWLLVLGQILFITCSRRSDMRNVCVAIAIAHNFLSLSTISWFSAFCLRVFQSYFSLKGLKSLNAADTDSESPSLKLSLIAWAIPIVFSSLFLTLEVLSGTLKPCLARGGICWYGDDLSFKILFVLPAFLMLAGDGCVFTAIMFGIREKQKGDTSSNGRGNCNSHINRRRSSTTVDNDRRKFRLCIRMGLLMFIAWLCAAIASLGGFTSWWYGFLIFSGLQGVFVFVSSGAKSKVTEVIWVGSTGHQSPEAEKRSRRRSVKRDVRKRRSNISY